MLHPEFFDFVKTARDGGAKCLTLTTNATLLYKPRIMESLLADPLDAVSLSLDAARLPAFNRKARAAFPRVGAILKHWRAHINISPARHKS